METYAWTTERGAKVEILVSQEHTDKMFCDGDVTERTVKALRLEKLIVNGKEFDGAIQYHKGNHIVSFKFNGQPAAAIIPAEIYDDMMAPTRAREAAAEMADKEYRDIYKGACPKCGTWCYGDCDAN